MACHPVVPDDEFVLRISACHAKIQFSFLSTVQHAQQYCCPTCICLKNPLLSYCCTARSGKYVAATYGFRLPPPLRVVCLLAGYQWRSR